MSIAIQSTYILFMQLLGEERVIKHAFELISLLCQPGDINVPRPRGWGVEGWWCRSNSCASLRRAARMGMRRPARGLDAIPARMSTPAAEVGRRAQ